MRRLYLLLTFLILSLSSYAQIPAARVSTERPSPVALVIPDEDVRTPASLSHYLTAHTSSRKEFARQLYSWLVWNITYDVANRSNPNYYKDTLDAAQKTLTTRMAVCQGYANLYYLVCKEAGIPVQLVSGYTQSLSRIDNVSHAWITIQIDNIWYMTDPTWGAGVIRGGKFIRGAVDTYFLVPPDVFVRTHIPFDPLWQLLDHPFTHEEFRDNKWTAAAGRSVFSYKDSVKAYNTMKDDLLKYQGVINRIERCGVTNDMTSHELAYYKNLVKYIIENRQVIAQNKAIDDFNRSSSQYNKAVGLFNEYVKFKNSQFTPVKTDREIRELINVVGRKLAESKSGLVGLSSEGVIKENIRQLTESLAALEKRVNDEQAFVDKYIKTGKPLRKSLF